VLLSGSGRTLANLLAHIDSGSLVAEVALVIASRPCRGAEIGREAGIETLEIAGDIPAARLGELLRSRGIDLVVLAGYMRLIDIPEGFEGKVVNIHPALLPKYGGTGMYGDRVHRAVIEAGDGESGCTVHLCDDAYDTGPIILQKRCPVLAGDTPESLAARVFELEKQAYPEALQLILSGGVPSPDGS
jgi:phosphoribosylglycinamide formyltransferase-1